MDPPAIEGSIKGFAWYKLMFEIVADCAAEKDAIYSTLEFASTDVLPTTVEFGLLGENEFL